MIAVGPVARRIHFSVRNPFLESPHATPPPSHTSLIALNGKPRQGGGASRGPRRCSGVLRLSRLQHARRAVCTPYEVISKSFVLFGSYPSQLKHNHQIVNSGNRLNEAIFSSDTVALAPCSCSRLLHQRRREGERDRGEREREGERGHGVEEGLVLVGPSNAEKSPGAPPGARGKAVGWAMAFGASWKRTGRTHAGWGGGRAHRGRRRSGQPRSSGGAHRAG